MNARLQTISTNSRCPASRRPGLEGLVAGTAVFGQVCGARKSTAMAAGCGGRREHRPSCEAGYSYSAGRLVPMGQRAGVSLGRRLSTRGNASNRRTSGLDRRLCGRDDVADCTRALVWAGGMWRTLLCGADSAGSTGLRVVESDGCRGSAQAVRRS